MEYVLQVARLTIEVCHIEDKSVATIGESVLVHIIYLALKHEIHLYVSRASIKHFIHNAHSHVETGVAEVLTVGWRKILLVDVGNNGGTRIGIYSLRLDGACHFALVFGIETIHFDSAASFFANDIVGDKEVEHVLHVVFEREFLAIDVLHEQRSDIVGGSRESHAVLLTHIAEHKQHVNHTHREIGLGVGSRHILSRSNGFSTFVG